MNDITRRSFLKAGLLAGVSGGLGRQAWARGAGVEPDASVASTPVAAAARGIKPWFDRPLRFANLTLVEEDAANFDPSWWLDYFARVHADGATISAGGYMAYYPTRIPLHHRADGMGGADPFGALYHGCRAQGMNVIARVDPHACRQDVKEAHPDWISTDAAGRPRAHLAMPDRWITCALGPYNFEFMRGVIAEIVARYPVDAVFSNRWNGLGWCYCPHCTTNFKAATGYDLPRTDGPGEPAREAFLEWQKQRLFSLWQLWDDTIRAANPAACFIPNMGAGIWQFLDLREIGRRAPILFADRQGRTAAATNGVGVTAPWAIGRAGKEFRAVMGRKPVGAGYSVSVEEPYRWKDSVQSEAEQRIWMADGVANGLLLSFGKVGARVRDRRWLDFTADFFQWHHRHERYLRDQTPLARVGMVYSQRSATHYRVARAPEDPTAKFYHAFAEYPYRSDDHASGLYQAMIEARVPFELVCDQLLEPVALDRFKLLLLPNISVLDDAQCAQLRAYVQRGGSLLATYETSLHDAKGPRSDFGLADLFGAHFRGWRQGPVMNSYLALEREARGAEEILRGFDGAEQIVGGVWQLDVVADGANAAASPLTLIPPYPHLPMEEVYPRDFGPRAPQVFLRTHGAGRVAYFPWDIDRVFWEALLEDHGRLLANTIAWALDEPPVVAVTGPGVLDVVPWRQADSVTVHLVNLSNPFMWKGPFREFLPVGEQRVRLQLPAGRRAARVRLLVAGTDVPASERSGAIEFSVPSILDREVVAVDLV